MDSITLTNKQLTRLLEFCRHANTRGDKQEITGVWPKSPTGAYTDRVEVKFNTTFVWLYWNPVEEDWRPQEAFKTDVHRVGRL